MRGRVLAAAAVAAAAICGCGDDAGPSEKTRKLVACAKGPPDAAFRPLPAGYSYMPLPPDARRQLGPALNDPTFAARAVRHGGRFDALILAGTSGTPVYMETSYEKEARKQGKTKVDRLTIRGRRWSVVASRPQGKRLYGLFGGDACHAVGVVTGDLGEGTALAGALLPGRGLD